jgi:RHS repeat-associated protein
VHNRTAGRAAEGIVAASVRDLLRVAARDGERAAGRRPAADAAHAATRAAARHTRPLGRRTLVGDPVDVVTGEVVLRQVDADLPGVLPLVLSRTHLSSYRGGELFGPSWASTLDQRLEFAAGAVTFVGEDGLVLPFPRGGDGQVPGWALATRAGGGYTVTDTAHGRILHFAPAASPHWPLSAITDRNGNRADIDRDSAGTPRAIRHSGGYRLTVDTAAGMVTGLRLGALTLVTFGYTGGRLSAVTNSSGLPYRLEYDPDGRLIAWTNRTGTRCEYGYDEQGRCVEVRGPAGMRSARLAYHPRRTEVRNSLGELTRYDLNSRGQVVREVDPLGHATTSRWDAHDRLLARADPLGRTTRYRYDAAGNLVAITRPDGRTAGAAYNELGLPTRISEPDGAVWRRRYDRRGNLVALTDPAGATTRYRYDRAGRPTAVTDALGHRRLLGTDAAGLITSVTDPLGARTTYTRDALGRVVTSTDPLGRTTRVRRSPEGAPIWRQAADGTTESWAYDPDGRPVTYTDQLGNTTRTGYTHFDLPTAHAGLSFEYDTELRLRTVTNQLGLTWHYEYDAAGNLAAERDFDGQRVTYRYDPAGQLTARVGGTGGTTTYEHDALGHLTAAGTTTYGYDPVGRLIRAASPDSEVTLERDALGQVLTETCDGRTVTSTYDPLGRRTSRRTPSGATSHWAYDPNHRPTTLRTGGQLTRFGYDPAGREVARRSGEHLLLTRTWTTRDAPATQTLATLPTAAPLDHTRYTYRADGHLTAAGPRTYDLDPAGRVTAVRDNVAGTRGGPLRDTPSDTPAGTLGDAWSDTAAGAERYAYDPAGNLAESNGRPLTYRGTRLHRAGDTRYEHDPAGRLTRRTDPDGGTWTYRWDATDRLTDLRTPTGEHWRYRYDPLGRRTAKQRLSGGATVEETTYTWDGPVLAEQRTHTGHTTWEYAPGTHRPLTQTQAGRCYAVLTDPTGTPTALVDPLGVLAWRHTATLWGHPRTTDAPATTCPLRFPGQYRDPESGLHYNHYRYYDPATAQYATPDPLRLAAGPNPYAYVPNPTRWTDPLGLSPEDLVDLYHGTSAENAAAVRTSGIDLTTSRRGLDFGPGFYTTRNLEQACEWAGRRGRAGDILHYRIPQSALSRLYGRVFAGPDADWTALVRQQRARAGLHGYDYVEGPMAQRLRGLRDGGSLAPSGNQVSFHTEAAVKILDRYLR